MAATAPLTRKPKTSRADGQTERPSAEHIVSLIRDELGEVWIPRLYRERILKMRTRSHKLIPATKGASVEVQHTLLGIELKVGRRRLSCPDLATARYLAVFSRAGLSETAVPYDITRISHLADELESSWQRMLLLAAHHTEGRGNSFASRVRSLAADWVKREVETDGPGAAVPQFNQETKQRRKVAQTG